MTAQTSIRLHLSSVPPHPNKSYSLNPVSPTATRLGSPLHELRDDLDRAVFDAYGWNDLADRLVGRPGATTLLPDKRRRPGRSRRRTPQPPCHTQHGTRRRRSPGPHPLAAPRLPGPRSHPDHRHAGSQTRGRRRHPDRTGQKAHLAQIHARPGRSRPPPPRHRPPNPGSPGQPLQAQTHEVDPPGPRRPPNPRPGRDGQRPLAPDMAIDQQHQGFTARPWPQPASTAARDNTLLKTTAATHPPDLTTVSDATRPVQYPIKHARTFIQYPCALPNHC